mmetsp:Transcript_22079/g.40105  ORF Transcript_22079/g.40105 Transcript_22079/m.40105 type:complete len:222 (-) Transcript_22079:794-1459(-)
MAGLMKCLLAGLLIRVNARYVTKNLILRDCKNVQDMGLEPLRDSMVLSMVLERFNIFCARRREGDLNVILRAGATPQYDDSPQAHRGRFLVDREESLVHQAVPLQSSCRKQAPSNSAMHNVLRMQLWRAAVAEDTRQLVANEEGIPQTTYCPNCRKHYYRKGSCPKAVVDCSFCLKAYCKSCDSMLQCQGNAKIAPVPSVITSVTRAVIATKESATIVSIL